jgi:hypothetical protein
VGVQGIRIIFGDVWMKEAEQFSSSINTIAVKSGLTVCPKEQPKWMRINGSGGWELVSLIESRV